MGQNFMTEYVLNKKKNLQRFTECLRARHCVESGVPRGGALAPQEKDNHIERCALINSERCPVGWVASSESLVRGGGQGRVP